MNAEELREYISDYEEMDAERKAITQHYKAPYNEIMKKIEILENRIEELSEEAFKIKESGDSIALFMTHEFDRLHNNKIVSVNVGQLVSEFSKLSFVPIDEIDVSMRFDQSSVSGTYKDRSTLKTVIHDRYFGRMSPLDDMSLIIHLSLTYKGINYYTFWMASLDDIQDDGKTLLEHCGVKIDENFYHVDNRSTLTIEENFSDIVITDSYSDLASGLKFKSSLPDENGNMLRQAFINALESKSLEKGRQLKK